MDPTGSATTILEFLNPSAIPLAVLVVVVGFLALRLIDRGFRKLAARFPRRRLLISQFSTVTAFLGYATAFLIAFGMVFNLSPQALFAVSGTVAVAFGFAFKDVAASFLAGISILTNKPFQVGDRIHFGGFYGEVKEIGLRTVRLVTLDDNLVTIPSNKFLTDPVASANAGALDCMVVIPFYVAPDADHLRAKELVRESVLASKYLFLGKPVVVLTSNRISEDGRVAVELTAKAYVFDTRHEKNFATDVVDRALAAFKREGIAVPARP